MFQKVFGHNQVSTLTELASYPALRTNQFNMDGGDKFRHKLMFCISIPSLIAITVTLYVYLLPLMYSDVISSQIQVDQLYYGFYMFNNDTTPSDRPISSFYAKLAKLMGNTQAVTEHQMMLDTFLKDLKITVLTQNQ